jgi:transcriptional regulator with XRE-family HTH domain
VVRRGTTDPVEVLALQLAADVTRIRQARQLSQAELAKLCGTTQSSIARLERGSRPPRLDTLARIAEALDCALDVRLVPRTALPGLPGGTDD